MRTQWIGFGALSLITLGCASGQGERVRDAHMAGIDARAEKKSEKLEEHASSRETAIDKQFDKRNDKIGDANRPGEDAQQALT